MTDTLNELKARVAEAAAARTPLAIRGGGTKDFYGEPVTGALLDTRAHAGIVDYEPSELVITARCGTPLAVLEAALAERNQMLACEPPHFGEGATVGGMVSAGLSGPRRMAAGAVRDFMLGVKLIDGRGDVLSFGGQVMKNVAGYDVSRLVCGALGTLGLITEVSLKVLPAPFEEATLRFDMSEGEMLGAVNKWGGQPLPISATAFSAGELRVRLSGANAAVRAACERLGGERIEPAQAAVFWAGVREQRDAFFAQAQASGLPLWRLSVPSVAPPLALAGAQFIEWGGALRWLATDAPATAIRAAAAEAGGHATLFRTTRRSASVFHPLAPAVHALNRRVKDALDPHRIFNPGRVFADL